MATAPKSLNPRAPDYIPLSNTASIITAPAAFPSTPYSSSTPFLLLPNQPPSHHLPPDYIKYTRTFFTHSSIIRISGHFPLLPPQPIPLPLSPLPPKDDVDVDVPPSTPPPRGPVSSSLAKIEPAAVRGGPARTITHNNKQEAYYYERPKVVSSCRVRAVRDDGSGLNSSCGRRRAGTGGFGIRWGSTGEARKRGSTTGTPDCVYHEDMNRTRSSRTSTTYVEKYGALPLMRRGKSTTVMIKNIPNEYTRLILVEFLDKHCRSENRKTSREQRGTASGVQHPVSAYDFLYLPIDFKTKKNKGFAFVNFTQPQAAWKFFKACHSTKWDDFPKSPKTSEIVRARIQGKEALKKHFQRAYFECESDEFLPLSFSPPRDGSGDPVKLDPLGNFEGRSLPRLG